MATSRSQSRRAGDESRGRAHLCRMKSDGAGAKERIEPAPDAPRAAIVGVLLMLAGGGYLMGPWGRCSPCCLSCGGLIYRWHLITTPVICDSSRTNTAKPDPAHLFGEDAGAIADFHIKLFAGQDPRPSPGRWTIPDPLLQDLGLHLKTASRRGQAPTSPNRCPPDPTGWRRPSPRMAATARCPQYPETDNQMAQAKGALPAHRSATGRYPAQGDGAGHPGKRMPSRPPVALAEESDRIGVLMSGSGHCRIRPICWRSTPPSRRAMQGAGRGFAVVADEVPNPLTRTPPRRPTDPRAA